MAGDGSMQEWSNGPGERYAPHRHAYRKTLRCVTGSIVFHVPHGDVELLAGDELVLEPGTLHAATVGPEGVRCVEEHA